MTTPLGDRIHALLLQHYGLENAITAPEIGRILGVGEREVRYRIAEESSGWAGDGKLLLAAPQFGFFFATDAEAIAHRERMLISLWLQAGEKVLRFQEAARKAGFGGLLLAWTTKLLKFIHGRPDFKTFVEQSHPERRRELREKAGA